MPQYTVITENEKSAWEDKTGVLYHFPKRYAAHLLPGTRVIYYTGKTTGKRYADERLTDAPHYFEVAEVGRVWTDPDSQKGDLFAEVVGFRPFVLPVLAKLDGRYIETIPESRTSNYWRDGVRPVDEATARRIESLATFMPAVPPATALNDDDQGEVAAFESGVEGPPTFRFVTTYERDPGVRRAANPVGHHFWRGLHWMSLHRRRSERKELLLETIQDQFAGGPVLLDEFRWAVFQKEWEGWTTIFGSYKKSFNRTLLKHSPLLTVWTLGNAAKLSPQVLARVAIYRYEHPGYYLRMAKRTDFSVKEIHPAGMPTKELKFRYVRRVFGCCYGGKMYATASIPMSHKICCVTLAGLTLNPNHPNLHATWPVTPLGRSL